jgi:hypothetical protein
MTSLPSRVVELDENVVLSASRILATGSYPVDMLLDFLWLLLSKASLVGNIDGAVSGHYDCGGRQVSDRADLQAVSGAV